MISTVSKAVHCWCKLNTKKVVNKLSVIGGGGGGGMVVYSSSIVYCLSSRSYRLGFGTYLFLYFCIDYKNLFH